MNDAPWKANEVIRHIHSGHPFLVIHVFSRTGTLICDLESGLVAAPGQVLLPKNYTEFAKDSQMEQQADRWHKVKESRCA